MKCIQSDWLPRYKRCVPTNVQLYKIAFLPLALLIVIVI